jgi:hypothetical protein
MTVTYEAPQTIIKMMLGAQVFLDSLRPDQRALAHFPLDDPERLDWDFIPKANRAGIPFWQLDRHQRVLAHNLLKSGLSMRGYTQALSIMAMENVLRERQLPMLGLVAGDFRSPEQYFFSIFGKPGFEDSFGWRVLGHHLSISYTVINQKYLTVTPCNMGAEPAQEGVLTPLREDDELGFRLLHSLPEQIRESAVIHNVAPADYTTRQVPRIGKVEYPDFVDLGIPWYRISDADREALKFVKDQPKGVPGSELGDEQRATLMDLVECYMGRMPEEVSAKHLEHVKDDGLENLWFAWAGGQEPGTSHYYRIQGSRILIEFDNAIDNGNHIHSVWRDYRNDLGHDLLMDHYEHVKTHGSHLKTRLESSEPEDER